MRHDRKAPPLMTAALIAAVCGAGAALAAGADVTASRHPAYGAHITDSEGMSLYLFEADSPGKSTCYGRCADAWPPLTADGKVQVGDEAEADLVGTIERRNGERQVTYDGMPLYYFASDDRPGDANGQEVEGFGGEWYLVAPDGSKVHE